LPPDTILPLPGSVACAGTVPRGGCQGRAGAHRPPGERTLCLPPGPARGFAAGHGSATHPVDAGPARGLAGPRPSPRAGSRPRCRHARPARTGSTRRRRLHGHEDAAGGARAPPSPAHPRADLPPARRPPAQRRPPGVPPPRGFVLRMSESASSRGCTPARDMTED